MSLGDARDAAGRAPLPEALATPESGPVLLFAPHPDDDLIGPGGTVALHRRQGDPVQVVVAYDGYLGNQLHPDLSKDEFIALREGEALRGGAHLGLDQYRFLRFPEGHEPGPSDRESAAGQLAALIHATGPATVYAPWVGEHNVDHHVLATVVRRALELSSFQGQAWGYEVYTPLVPTRVVDISATWELKAKAIAEHNSQTPLTDLVHHVGGLNQHRALYLEKGATHGEAFAPL